MVRLPRSQLSVERERNVRVILITPRWGIKMLHQVCFVALVKTLLCSMRLLSRTWTILKLIELTKHLPWTRLQSFYVLTPDLPYSDHSFSWGEGRALGMVGKGVIWVKICIMLLRHRAKRKYDENPKEQRWCAHRDVFKKLHILATRNLPVSSIIRRVT